MSTSRVVDLHPEDLIERDAAGGLDEAERSRLEAHLARCATCRLERQLRADFADEIDAGFLGLPDGVPGALVAAPEIACAGAPRSAPPPPSSRPGLVGVRGRARARALWLPAAAALVLMAGGAFAAIGLRARAWPSPARTPRSAQAAPPAVAPEPARPKRLSGAARVAPPIEGSVDVPAQPPAAAPPPAAVAAPPASPASAEDLFDAETNARQRGEYARVMALHRELARRFPRSRQAQVSRASIGELLLDRGAPAGALAELDAYLAAGSGNLGEEAMVGRATALDRLGRFDEASLAWKALLAAFPDTPYAAHAKARVESLAGN